MTIVYSLIVLGSAGLIAGVILIAAYSRLKVEEDPRVEEVLEKLPGSNCGACGFASCHEYAVSVAGGSAAVDLCRIGGAALSSGLAKIMGVDHSSDETSLKVAVLCGVKERKMLAEYSGTRTCAQANLTGGGMACRYGCLGYGDCMAACPFDAIRLDEAGVPVISLEKCTACGLCVKACPRNIIELRELTEGRLVYVGCSNRQSGKITRQVCAVGCIACKICEKKAPEGAFKVDDNLSRVKLPGSEINVPDIKCPTNCIYEKTQA